jgi:hypothetical protein
MIGCKRNGAFQRSGRFVVANAACQHDAEVVPGNGQIRLQLAGMTQRLHCRIEFARCAQYCSQRVVVKRVLRALRYCASHRSNGV